MRVTRSLVLFYLALTGMELTYLYLLVSMLNSPAYITVLILLLYPLALLSSLVISSNVPRTLRIGLELSLVVILFLSVLLERLLGSLAVGQADAGGILLRLFFCVLVWLMGHTVPKDRVKFPAIAFRLQIGLLCVLIFSQIAGSAPPVFIFFLLTPVVLFLARWASSLSRDATVLKSPGPGYLFFAGGSVIVPGLVLVLLLSPDVGRAIVSWLGNIFEKISEWLDAQHQAATTPSEGPALDLSCNMRTDTAGSPDGSMAMPSTGDGSGGISPLVVWIILLIIFLGILALIGFLLKRKRLKNTVRTAEPVRFQVRMVSLGSLRNLLYLILELIKKIWFRLISSLRRLVRRTRRSEEPLISIRALYRNLLDWAAGRGMAPVPSQTPLEYLVAIKEKFPRKQDDLETITEAYLLARYSRRTVSPEEFDRIKESWYRVKADTE